MVASYLLERRRTKLEKWLPEILFQSFGGLSVLLVALAFLPGKAGGVLVGILLGLASFVLVPVQLWHYSSLWLSLRQEAGLEELQMTATSLPQMVDETARFCLGRVTAVVGLPSLGLCLLVGTEGGWLASVVTALVLVTICLSLSYTVQAWSAWSSLAWYWGLLGIPVAFEGLLGVLAVMLHRLEEFGFLLFLLAMVWVPRGLALAGLRREGTFRKTLNRFCFLERPVVSLGEGNPVFARNCAKLKSSRAATMALLGVLTSAGVGFALAWEFQNTSEIGLLAVLGGVVALFCGAALFGFSETRRERSSGALELVELSALTGPEIVAGLASWSALFPTVLLVTAVPGVVLGGWWAGCLERAVLILMAAPLLIAAGAFLGVAVARRDDWARAELILVGLSIVLSGLTLYHYHLNLSNVPAGVVAALFLYASFCLHSARQAALEAFNGES